MTSARTTPASATPSPVSRGGGISTGAITYGAVKFEQGPVAAGLVYTSDKTNPVTANVTQLGASYDMRAVKLYGLYEDGRGVPVCTAKTAYSFGTSHQDHHEVKPPAKQTVTLQRLALMSPDGASAILILRSIELN